MSFIIFRTSCLLEVVRTLVQQGGFRFIGGIVGLDEEPNMGLKFIGEIVGLDEEPKTWINQ